MGKHKTKHSNEQVDVIWLTDDEVMLLITVLAVQNGPEYHMSLVDSLLNKLKALT